MSATNFHYTSQEDDMLYQMMIQDWQGISLLAIMSFFLVAPFIAILWDYREHILNECRTLLHQRNKTPW